MGIRYVRALIVVALLAAPAFAHEIGTTQVIVAFHRDHTYSIDVISGPQTTLNKLERAAGEGRSRNLTDSQLAAQLRAHGMQFLNSVEARFNNQRVRPALTVIQQPMRVVMRLSGDIPRGATTFTWRYALASGSYALAVDGSRVWLDADAASPPFALSFEVRPPTRLAIVRQYFILGFTHILPNGVDHILFVLGMFLLTARLKDVLAQVTAFTVAHSITLGLTMYGAVSVSPRIVEPAIALSIAYIAIENVMTSHLRPWRVAIVFCFGLLHGMGFAGVLKELGLPRSEFLPALVSFNVGVEAGQLTVIAAAFLLFAYWWQAKPWYRQRFVVPASMLIGAIGLFWTVQRVVG